jgi:uncharacterized protein (TIGR03437 family)
MTKSSVLTRAIALVVPMTLWMDPAAFGYIRQSFVDAKGVVVPVQRIDNTGIQFYLNNLIVPGVQSSASGSAVTVISPGSDPVFAVTSAAATWNAVATANVHFLPVLSTARVIDPMDFQMTIAIGSTASDLSALGGAVAITLDSYVTGAGVLNGVNYAEGNIYDSDIVLNPAVKFSTDGSTSTDLQAVMTHEFGHSLSANHSGLLGATMFQYASLNERYLSVDDVSLVTSAYPASTASLGTITGKVVASDGSAVQNGLVTMIDTAGGNVVGSLTGTDGSYTVQAPAASYMIYVEPMAAGSIVQPANLYFPASTVVTTNFQTTALGGFSAPTQLTVAAGKTTTVPNLTVTAGTSALQQPYIGVGKAGGSGSIGTVASLAEVAPSGQSIDIALIGGGIDGTVAIQALGQGVSVQPGSVRVDSSVSFGGILTGMPLVRVTLNLTSRQTSTLASLIITKGQSTIALSGVAVIVPPTPVISSVNDAESARTSIVPGEWVAIYGSNLANSYYVWAGTDFVSGNLLPVRINGVSVQFNGTPAAVYFTLGTQINAQAPSGLSGNVNVTVSNNGSYSAPFVATAVPVAPSLFNYPAGSNFYPAAVHLSGAIVGDPSALAGTTKALPGETIVFFVNGLASSSGGSIVSAAVPYTNPVTLTIGTATATPSYAGLVAAGEYQLNVTIPTTLAPGNYPITVSTQGQTSPSGIILPVGP